MRASRAVPPAPGMTPRRTSVNPISAVSAAIRMSHASASSSPPPNAAPLIAAITGRRNAATAFISRLSSSRNPHVCSSDIVRRSFRSAPAEKALPAPVTTTARTSLPCFTSAASCPNTPASSATSPFDSALAASGRFSVTKAVFARRSSRTNPVEPSVAVGIRPDGITSAGDARSAGAGARTGADGGPIVLGGDLVADQRRREARAVDQAIQIDAGAHAHPLQHVDDVLGGDVAGRAGRVGATAEAAQRGVDGGDAHLDGDQDVGRSEERRGGKE